MYLSNITLAEVTNCNFEVNNEFTTNGGYGLYLDNSTSYTVEENNFYSDMATPTGIGLIVHNSGTAPNEIYRNKFINLDQGVSAQEINRDSRRTQGLQILCCEFETCNFDILVPQSQLAGRGICYYQGANSQFAEDMAGNLFDIHGQNPDDDFDDINNQGAYFNYFYPTNNDDYRVKPIDYTLNTINRVGELVLYDNWSYYVDCPPSSTGGGGSESELLTNLTNVNQEISSTEQTLLSLVDGGDTEALYQTVEYSVPPEATNVFNEMMETSPYLSDSVVGAAIEKENVVPDAMLRDVMVANPHSAKSEKLIEKLDNRYTPLPEYMKSQIMTSRSQVSLKEKLESKLNKYRLEKKRVFSGLMHHYMDSDSITGWRDSITNLLANDNDLQSKYRLAMWQLHNREFTQSVNTMNSIPGMFDLQGDLLTVYNDMVSLHSILSDMLSSDSCSFALTSSQAQQLTTLAQASAPASGYARNILIMTGNLVYTEPIQVPDRLKSSKADNTYEKEFNVDVPSVLEVYPNPATGYFVLGYQLDSVRTDAIVEIRNTIGELINTIPVTNEIDKQMINTDTWQAGIYIITLKQKGDIIESAKLTLMK